MQQPTVRKNKLGQEIRQKGGDTRQKLLAAAMAQLETVSPMHITVHGIARDAGLSPATFYVYFTDIQDIVYELCEAIGQDIAELTSVVDEPWPQAERPARIRRYVETHYAFWKKNRVLLAVRNLEVALGDRRFLDRRLHVADRMMEVLAARILEAGQDQPLSHDEAIAMANVIVSALAALEQRYTYPPEARQEDPTFNVTGILEAQVRTISKVLNVPYRRPR